MLENYLTMKATHKVKIGENDYNEPIFIEKEISCRLIDKFKIITDSKGEQVVSNGVIQCLGSIKNGDLINDRKIISVNPMTSLEGVIGYRGYLL